MEKGNLTKGHPLVPKLDFQWIFDWREKQNTQTENEEEEEGESEEVEEEELMSASKKIMPTGSTIRTSAS